MLGKPKFKRDDKVSFILGGETKEGYVYIVDAYGTFFQEEEPSYDILVKEGGGDCLYKHIPESLLVQEGGAAETANPFSE